MISYKQKHEGEDFVKETAKLEVKTTLEDPNNDIKNLYVGDLEYISSGSENPVRECTQQGSGPGGVYFIITETGDFRDEFLISSSEPGAACYDGTGKPFYVLSVEMDAGHTKITPDGLSCGNQTTHIKGLKIKPSTLSVPKVETTESMKAKSFETLDPNGYYFIFSPNGTKYAIWVDNTGVINTTAV